MHVLVLGSGVIGTAVAYYLARSDHQVTVVDRQPGPGLETSFANAAQVSPGYAAPWAGPGVPLKVIQWLMMRHSPLVIKPMLDPAMWRWGAHMLRHCTHARYQKNKSRMLRLAEYSRICLQALRADTGIRYDERTQGTLQLFRTHKQLDGAAKDVKILRDCGVSFEVLDAAGYLRHEPALADVQHKFVGALRLPKDETGDCFKFTEQLAALARAMGVQFRFGVQVQALETRGSQITGVHTSDGFWDTDCCVLAMGSYSTPILKPLSVHIPVYPVKGYSITAPISDMALAPESTVMDETHKVAVTRLGSRVRVGGIAGLCGFDLRLDPARRRTLEFVVGDLFPRACDLSRADFWCGLRPMTPDGTPIIGASPIQGLWLSTGHGTLGWTMACGTGRVIADLVSRRKPEIDMEGLGLERYQSEDARRI